MSSAIFTNTLKQGWVNFEGQLKTKGNESKPYDIPVMVDYQYISKAMNWLAANGKRNPIPAKAHQNYSKPLSAVTKVLDEHIDYIYRGTTNVHDETHLTCHKCRQIYAQIWKESSELTGSPIYRISFIMGHGENDKSSGERYDCDFEVKDAKLILEMIDREIGRASCRERV